MSKSEALLGPGQGMGQRGRAWRIHMSNETQLTITERATLARTDILDAFAAFLRLNVAQGDARR